MKGIKNNEKNLYKANFSKTLKNVRKIKIFKNQNISMKKKMITTILSVI